MENHTGYNNKIRNNTEASKQIRTLLQIIKIYDFHFSEWRFFDNTAKVQTERWKQNWIILHPLSGGNTSSLLTSFAMVLRDL